MPSRTTSSHGAILLGLVMLCAPPAIAQSDATAEKQANIELGLQHDSAAALYQALKERADGGQPLEWTDLPDWSGVYTRYLATRGAKFDPDQRPGGPPTARLTPEHQQLLQQKMARAEEGYVYDPLGHCAPAGYPRWLTEPFLRDFVVTPDQTWLINELANEIRRIYTDGRDHFPEEDRYPTADGDSIGFWDGHRLVIHTNQLSAGEYTRVQPNYTDQVETVEIWEKVGKNLEVDVWAYDPGVLAEPWYVKQTYAEVDNPDKYIRIHYFYCFENPNNDVHETEGGGTQFTDFTFTDEDDG